MNEEKLPKLMNAIYWAYNQGLGDWTPGIDGTTYCNFAVNYVCKAIGYMGFGSEDPILANEMIRRMKDPNGDWMVLGSPEVAQAKANEGSLVVAGSAFAGGHGHVCVVIPGLLEYSGTWKKLTPKVMNIGKTIFIGKKASWAFQADNEPDFFGLKETL